MTKETMSRKASDNIYLHKDFHGALSAGIEYLDRHYGPSKGRLLKYKHIQPYPDYCRHYDVLYRRVLEPLGYRCELDLSACDRAKCSFTVVKYG
ncbi:MAG: hypothetical protein V2A65_03775 [Candidatus Omnitrophota bacterium]